MIQFITDKGVAVPTVTAAQMREVDRIAVEETGPNLFQMMENAGRNLAELAIELAGVRARVLVLAGARRNGRRGHSAAPPLANPGRGVGPCPAAPHQRRDEPALPPEVVPARGG